MKMKNEIKNIDLFIEEKNIEQIFLDWDGVLSHSVKAIVDIINEENGTKVKPNDILSWNFKEADPSIDDEYMEYLFTTEKFFKKMEFIKGALDFLKKHENNIIIVTKAKTNNYINKRKLLDKLGFEKIPIIPIPIEISKSIINMSDLEKYSIFIDDSTNNLLDSNADYVVQFREYKDDKQREWQIGWNGLVMYHW